VEVRAVLLQRLHARRRSDEGATLIEMVVALMIFGVVSAALLSLLLSTVRMVGTTKARTVAAGIAASVVDETRSMGAMGAPQGRTTTNRTVGGREFTVVRDAQLVARGSESACADSGALSFLRVRVVVKWAGMGSVRPVESGTVLNRPSADGDAATGAVAVRLRDSLGQPVSDATVSLTPGAQAGNGTVQRTTEDGCAFFAFVTPGIYTASVSKAGYLSRDGKESPTLTKTVSAGAPLKVEFEYDAAASLSLTPAFAADSQYPPPADLPVTLFSPTVFTNATFAQQVTGTWPLQVPMIYPHAAGYSLWAGACLAHNPAVQGVAGQVAAVVPGKRTDVVVNLAPFEVRRNRGSKPAPVMWTVTATHAKDAANGCTTPQSYQFKASSASIDALSGSLPFGTWTFTVSDGTRTRSSAPVVLSPSSSTAPIVTVTLP
jgi:hypothetical protein